MNAFRNRLAVVMSVALGALIVGPSAVALEVPPNPVADIVLGLLGQSDADDDPNGPGEGELPEDGGKFEAGDDPNATGEVPGNGGKFRGGKQIKGVDRPFALPGAGA